MKILKFVLLMVFALILTVHSSIFAQTAEWTLMFYMDADNDLEAPQMTDLVEMMTVGSTANINLVVLADRSEKGDNVRGYTNRAVGGVPHWTTAKLMVIEKGRLRQLANWGEVNMGDPATLQKFTETVAAQFPAKRYGLVFGDHGDGWNGIVGDESHDGDTLTARELTAALQTITQKTGKFELIGFDACLMANLETAQAIAPFGKAMVASEELEPGDGWDYSPIIQTLSSNPEMDGFALGRIIVNAYRDYYLGPKKGNRDKTVTLAVIDLSKIPAIEAAVNNLAGNNVSFLKVNQRESWLKTARARKATEEFGAGDESKEGSHFYDLAQYAENLKQQQPDAATSAAADQVIAAVKSAVIHKIAGEAHSRSYGISIYFPPQKETLTAEKSFPYQETHFAQRGKWLGLLNEYLGLRITDTQKPQMESVKTDNDKVAKNDAITIVSQVEADDIETATFILAETDDEGQIIIGAIPTEPDENGVLKEEWDGSWFSIGDGNKELICPVTDFAELEKEDTFLVEVPAQVRYQDEENWRDVTLYFYLDFNEKEVVGEFVYAFEVKGNKSREVELLAGDSVRPVYLAVDNNGETKEVASEDPNNILTLTEDDNLVIGGIDVAPGKYLIGFAITDFAGNESTEFTEVTIE